MPDAGRATTTSAANICPGCGEPVVKSEGGYVTGADGPGSIKHVDCMRATYLRGRRDGYKDAVRQIRAAYRVLKGQGKWQA